MFTIFFVLPGKEIFTGKVGDFHRSRLFRSNKNIILPFSHSVPFPVRGDIFHVFDMENCSGAYGRIPEYPFLFFHIRNIRLYQ